MRFALMDFSFFCGRMEERKISLLCKFDGISIYMYNDEHNPPHFHAYYGEYEAIFTFDGNILAGNMPINIRTKVIKWTLARHTELIAAWECAINFEPLGRIRPLIERKGKK